MPKIARVQLDDGRVARFEVPDNFTPQQAEAAAHAHFAPKPVNRGNVMGGVDAFMRGASDMMTFGAGDKIAAGLNAVLPIDKLTNPNIKSVWETGDLGGAFRSNLKEEQRIAAEDAAAPVRSYARGAGQVAGAVVGPVPGRALIAKGVRSAARGAVGAGAAARVVRPVAGAARMAAEGAVQSGLHGVGEGDSTSVGERLSNGGRQAVAGGVGSLVGAGVVRGAARSISPVVNPAVQRLADMGVIMTPGQRAGRGFTQWVENAAESFPPLGVVIRGAKRRGVEQFNRGAINEALKPIGKVLPSKAEAGRSAVEAAQEIIGDNYDQALAKVRAPVDAAFTSDMAATVARARGLPPEQASAFDYVLKNKIAPLLHGNVLDGAALQDVHRTLQKLAADAEKTPVAGEMLADEFRAVRQHFLDLAARHSPDGADHFLRTNAAEANLSRVYDAASKAHGDGVFTPHQLSVATAKRGYGTTMKSAAAGDARMQDVSDAGKAVLPNNVPNSGTPERLWATGIASTLGTGAATINPIAAAPLAPGVAYLPGIDAALQKFALRGQGKGAKALAHEVRKRAYIGGMFGAPLGVISSSD